MGEVELFTAKFTPFGQRVQVALTEKKIPFKLTIVDFSNKPQALLNANPIHKQVPTIIHNGKPVAESLVILQYLEDAFPEQVPLMPKDAFEKSKVRFWTDYVYKLFSTIMGSLQIKPGTPEKEAAHEAIISSVKTLETGMTSFSAEGPFFAGDKFGFLDVILAPFCSGLAVLENVGHCVCPGPDELPRFHKWVEAIRVYPSVSSCVPPGEETIAFLKARRQQAAR